MPTCYIMRGLPGSGKSTVVDALCLALKGMFARHSTDNYFYEGGIYKFDPSKLPEYHQRNYDSFCQSIDKGFHNVFVDNTNTRRWEFERYYAYAYAHGYTVQVITVACDVDTCAKRNSHNVPRETIEKMLARWEE